MLVVNSVLLLTIWIASSYAEESLTGDVSSAKEMSMRLEDAPAEKDLSSSEHDELSTRLQASLQGVRSKKDSIAPDIESKLLHDEFDKRAPMGFHGMRGKKDYLISEFEDPYLRDEYEKRAPMGFQGMRGKKAILENGYYKRAPMGFQGMRGKKSFEEAFQGTRGKSYALEYPQGYEKRLLAMGLQGMRDKKEEFPTEWEKRAPMGFQGMRGKKTLFDEIEELEKRAIVGLQGGRDKKNAFENYVDYYMDPMELDKRAPMGFHGMRGKKDSDKRATMGFQGMRGKRNTERYGASTGFESRPSIDYQGMGDRRNDLALCRVQKRSPFRYFEMRDKKYPRWELRGKFVGVRGKKWAAAPYEDGSLFISVYDNTERTGVDEDSSAALDLQ